MKKYTRTKSFHHEDVFGGMPGKDSKPLIMVTEVEIGTGYSKGEISHTITCTIIGSGIERVSEIKAREALSINSLEEHIYNEERKVRAVYIMMFDDSHEKALEELGFTLEE